MCDYSLHNVATRPAKLEDELVTTKFSNSVTHGFAAVGEPQVAVCLLPGTELASAIRHQLPAEQEDRTATCPLPIDQYGQDRDPS